MNSKEIDLLIEIDNELSQYQHLSKDQLFTLSVNRRLAANLHMYNDEINEISEFLTTKTNDRVLNAMTKIRKFSDKDIIKTYMEEDSYD